ncbi:MAG: nucleoside monophosphate kinase [Candidatus Omnitrophica bacterium]|nr:nucleoside monophosphate kinase [Candidatus Omnitrophota bacterium]MDE2008805.1 nucleoside monophosphate kinase [Candidatus Omnitrophota bacterium]MDE2213632.1 nucleoside monophosphate kinase [Candidatus Omnitrophota bacterium]MDE2230467.1 nucleoside monophosphate kinase [Candidatus Omnitrophota bacterium]
MRKLKVVCRVSSAIRNRMFMVLRHPESNKDTAVQNLIKDAIKQFIGKVRIFTILGKAGCGKGTLSAWLIKELNKFLPEGSRYETLVLGGYFRKILKIRKDPGSASAEDLEKYGPFLSFVTDRDLAEMKAGKMISDETVINVVTAVLKTEPYNKAFGLFFDGFPRNLEQVKILQSGKILWQGKPLAVDLYVHAHIPRKQDTVFKQRAQMRIAQEISKAALENRPAEIREDDRPEVIDERLNTFYQQTQPAIRYVLKNLSAKSFKLEGTVQGQIEDSIVMDRAKFMAGWIRHLKGFGVSLK